MYRLGATDDGRSQGGHFVGKAGTHSRQGVAWGVLPLLLLLGSGAGAFASATAEPMRVLIPLYARPGSDFWTQMVEAATTTTVDYSVVINPNSGPGTAAEAVYTEGIQDLIDAGVEVLCYVATGFGATDVSVVTADLAAYESFYPGLCGGYFFDEGPGNADNVWKYTEYYNYAQDASSDADSTIVVNPGVKPDESLYDIGDAYEAANPGTGGQVVVVSFENTYLKFDDGTKAYVSGSLPYPPRYVEHRYMHSLLVYAAYFATNTAFLDFTVLRLYCENWGYVYFTDDSFGNDANPWDEAPTYFTALLDAVAKAPLSAAQCGTHAPTPAPF